MLRCVFLCLATAIPASAQWIPVSSPVKTDLLSVDLRDDAVWASGTRGVVLHSTDGGQSWQPCARPTKDADVALTSIAAIDAATAVVISSGKGEASKTYRTSDGCKTWKVVFENREETGSFAAIKRVTGKQIYLLAEPVGGKFLMYFSQDGGEKWFVTDDAGLDANKDEAASGSLAAWGPFLYFGTSNSGSPRLHYTDAKCPEGPQTESCPVGWNTATLPGNADSVGAISFRSAADQRGRIVLTVVAFTNDATGSKVAVSADGGKQWATSSSPTGMRAVAAGFSVSKQTWIAVGANGTMLSPDLGKRWVRGPEAGSPMDSGWTAIALPYAVGTEGRIGRLDESKLH